MIIDALNNMVGNASHIREVGPHQHAWVTAGSDSAGYRYDECGICGTRRTMSPLVEQAEKRQWLCGGAWDDPPNVTQLDRAVVEPMAVDRARAEASAEPVLAPTAPLPGEAAVITDPPLPPAAVVSPTDEDDDGFDDDEPVTPVRRRGRPPKGIIR